MKLIATLVTLLLLATGTQAQTRSTPRRHAPPSATAAEIPSGNVQQLPIRRVILYSNGVAYVERRGPVSGHAEISLSFKQSQVDDVLKSMVVLDLGRGRIGAVSYNSSAPPNARLAEIPFSIEPGTEEQGASGGLAGVLKQLQGARVVVTAANRTATGAILTVEERRAQIAADKPPQVTHSLVIASETGEIASFDLAEVRSVKLVDEVARRDINQFANVSASARRRDAKTIVVTSDGDGTREMLISYTIAAPIWKTTYRVVLDATGQPFFQGWAIVDNVSEEDWADVKLSLISGTPVSFIQPIQRPLYRYRPVIPIPEDLNLDPQVYEAALDGMNTGGGDARVGGGGAGGSGGGVAADAPVVQDEMVEVAPSTRVAGRNYMMLSDAMTKDDSSVKTAARGGEVGDLFQYSIDQPVTVRRDRSALIPILQTRMEGERVSIYNEAARRERPMGGLRLKNTSNLTLEDGSLTVIDGDAYAGEALIERLKPGEDRFISFALDLGTLVDARLKNGREPVFLVRVVNGNFQAHYYQSELKTYTVVNQTERPRTLYIEHPRRAGWTLSKETPAPAEVTASVYRFRLELAPHQKTELPVGERRALMDTYALTNLTTDDLALFVSQRYLDDTARAALSSIIDLKRRIAEADARLKAMEKEIADIGEDQERLRENIKALGTTAEARTLIARYIQKANEQETRIEALTAERQKLSVERARLQTELDNSIRTLSLERNF